MDTLSFSGKTSISRNVTKGKKMIVQVPEGTGVAAFNVRIDLCGGTDGMDGTHGIEWQCYQLQLVWKGDGISWG